MAGLSVFAGQNSLFALGSYACYTVGQKTSFGGAEGESVNNLLFAGEHCSADYQGYMNGGPKPVMMPPKRFWKR